MTEHERLKNVINALELCTSDIETRTQVPCEKCQYRNKEYHGVHGDGFCNMRSLQRDILALLKAQEPRILDLHAPETDWLDDILWLEIKGKKYVKPCMHRRVNSEMMFGRWEILIYFNIVGSSRETGYMVKDYGRKWRCWTLRPTDELRLFKPWQD